MEKYFKIIDWAYNFSVVTLIIPVIVAVFRWKFLNFPLKITAINATRMLLLGMIGLYFYYSGQSNRLIYYLSTCIDIVLVSLLYASIFDLRKEMKWGLGLLCVIFIGLMANDYLTTKTLISSYLSSSETVFVIIVSILMLRKVALTYKSSPYKRSLIWIISALLIMNLYSILVSLLIEKMSAYSNDFMQLCWYLSSPVFIIITNLMSAYGFYIIRNKVKEA
jgi:hypothetical protein